MDTPLFAWEMRDKDYPRTRLHVYFVLTGRLFSVGTQWPGEATNWKTWQHANDEEAAATAVNHTRLLETGGDTMHHGPVAVMVHDPSYALQRFVDKDVPSETLDYLYDHAMGEGRAA